MPTTPTHITAAIRALLDHIDEHNLPLPIDIATPGNHAIADVLDARAIAVDVEWGQVNFARWEESLPEGYTYDERLYQSTSGGGDFMRAMITGVLPIGVRVVVVGRWRIANPNPMGTSTADAARGAKAAGQLLHVVGAPTPGKG